MSSMPIENAAQQAAASGAQPIIGADGHVQLPSTEELLKQVTEQQLADSAAKSASGPQVSFTPASNGNMAEGVQSAPQTLDPRVLAKSLSAYVKAQTQFIHDKDLARYVSAMESHADTLAQFVHDKHLPSYAGAMEEHITEMTAVLERQGVL